MTIIKKYFPNLSEKQLQQFEQLDALYRDWNAKINVISRKDIDNLYEHHILHSLGIAKLINFSDGTEIIDLGTGGGFPGIPLAILFPNVKFKLIDSIAKKILVATEISKAIGLENVTLKQQPMQEVKEKFDFVVSRAVMPLDKLAALSKKNIKKEQKNAMPNGIICLKGGEVTEEIAPFKRIAEVFDLSDFFEEEFFETKKVIYLPL
ncbi:MAG: 16S rRNA (guanine(527)-N(7))-methyltransferase RsmG [Paludibacteraceae bacterium]|nr:16S rRNA (guanine(527)-N(7))-methyltransferase RsmG [Paludibacteraceae bacterium]